MFGFFFLTEVSSITKNMITLHLPESCSCMSLYPPLLFWTMTRTLRHTAYFSDDYIFALHKYELLTCFFNENSVGLAHNYKIIFLEKPC